MKNTIRALLLAGAAILAACGGSNPPSAQAPVQMASVTVKGGGAAIGTKASDYYDVAQRIYVAYFGRPTDPDGLDFWATQMLNARAPTTFKEVKDAYASNTQLKAIIDFFGTSAESQALYPGDNEAFISAIYRNMFSREPDAGGRAFWAGLVNQGVLTRSAAAITLMGEALGSDVTIIDKKVAMASAFTAALDTPAKRQAYGGLEAASAVRAMLSTVTLTSDPATNAATISATISKLMPATVSVTFSQVQGIIKNRCAGCHSAHPSIGGFNPAPAGIILDTESQIRANAARIRDTTIDSEFMPYANMTGMTAEERATIAAWLKAGTP